jgi:hypothetical protein
MLGNDIAREVDKVSFKRPTEVTPLAVTVTSTVWDNVSGLDKNVTDYVYFGTHSSSARLYVAMKEAA